MNVFSSCLIFISLLNPLFSHGLDVTSPKDYMSTGSGGFSEPPSYLRHTIGTERCLGHLHFFLRKFGHSKYESFNRARYIDATGCQPSAGASAPSRRTCDQRFEPTKQGILCESTCDNPKF
ncbi:hypothetical protein PSTT_09281 [Puccinia striiformis]|uniref:Uncharacterized protein n=1 Tax=Puccinia striiformis TaxID=27350 RepID=A0A2S4V907_9BASI|nr:hypothetical protein PSTT_09281 [Puccinia striiformis]